METLGAEIRRLRKAAGLTQAELANELGVTQAYVGMLETGKRSIAPTKVLFVLCDALGVDCNHFRMCLTDDPSAPENPAPKPKKK